MNTGFGFSEMLVIVLLIVVFFGSKELPHFIREIAKFTTKVRRYSDRIKREIDNVTRSADPQPATIDEQKKKKAELRKRYCAERSTLTGEEREKKSNEIMRHLLSLDQVKNAGMILCYAETATEVQMQQTIRKLLESGKRVMLPYVVEGTTELSAAEIRDPVADLAPGVLNIREPKKELRKNFFKSDLQAIICPGVAFDLQGGRLGRGKGYYDIFLRELRGKIPLIGVAFDCQIMKESLPFEYHDVHMDVLVTESGVVFGALPVSETRKPDGLAG